jgi:S1-C subfamily serine protease
MYCLTESHGKKLIADIDSVFPTFAEYALFDSKAEKIDGLHRAVASSSGSIVSSSGLVLTVAHALEEGQEAKVIYRNRVRKAFVVFRDEKLDVMLLRFDTDGLGRIPFLRIDGGNLNLGQNLFGIGYPCSNLVEYEPLFYNLTVTSFPESYNNHFQIDGQMATGASGMCLVNSFGQIVGIVRLNSKIISKSQKQYPNDWNIALKSSSYLQNIRDFLPVLPTSHKILTSETIAQGLMKTSVVVLACEES